MSNVTMQLSDKQNVVDSRVKPSGSASPTWWIAPPIVSDPGDLVSDAAESSGRRGLSG